MKALAQTLVASGLAYLLMGCSNVTGAAGGLAPRTGDVWYVRASSLGSDSVWYCANPGDHPSRVVCTEALLVDEGEPDPADVSSVESAHEGTASNADGAAVRTSCSDLRVDQVNAALQVSGVAIPGGSGGLVADGSYVLTRRESVAAEPPQTHRAILLLSNGSTRFELASSIDREPEQQSSGTAAFDRDGRLHLNAICPMATALPYDRFVATSDNSRITLVSTALHQAVTFERSPAEHPAVATDSAATSTPSAPPTAPAAPAAVSTATETPAGDPTPRRRHHH